MKCYACGKLVRDLLLSLEQFFLTINRVTFPETVLHQMAAL